MEVDTTRFGTIEVPDDDIVTFTDGVPGFPGPRQMVLLGGGALPGGEPGDGHHSLFWLQDLAEPDVAFLTMVPWVAYPDYDIEIEGSDLADPDDMCVLVILTVRREDGGVRLTSNLLAPIVIDTAARVGRQVILQDQSWPVQAPLVDSAPTPAGAGA